MDHDNVRTGTRAMMTMITFIKVLVPFFLPLVLNLLKVPDIGLLSPSKLTQKSVQTLVYPIPISKEKLEELCPSDPC